MPDLEKLRLVDAILTDLDKIDPELDRIWVEEKSGEMIGALPILTRAMNIPGSNAHP